VAADPRHLLERRRQVQLPQVRFGVAGSTFPDARGEVRIHRARIALTELLARGRGSRGLTASLRVGVDGDGSTVVEPRGSGGDQVLGIVLTEILVAQQTGTWTRLKICRNHKCAIAFYDHSPNVSAVWHNAKRCGNAENLRRSRTRRRTDTP
jgi:hypothetical protein